MARYVEGSDRQQVTLLPECLRTTLPETTRWGSSSSKDRPPVLPTHPMTSATGAWRLSSGVRGSAGEPE